MVNISSIFSKSPFKPLREHMEQCVKSVEPVEQFFIALQKGDNGSIKKYRDLVFEIEDGADKIKNEVRNNLPKSIFMPIDRRDLLEVLDVQDSIADVAQDIVALLAVRKMKLPTDMESSLFAFLKIVKETCFLAQEISGEFDDVLESGFGHHQIEAILKKIDSLNLMEDKTDEMEILMSEKLFVHEDKMKPVDVVFWYEIFEWIGDLADYAEKMGNRLRLLLVKG